MYSPDSKSASDHTLFPARTMFKKMHDCPDDSQRLYNDICFVNNIVYVSFDNSRQPSKKSVCFPFIVQSNFRTLSQRTCMFEEWELPTCMSRL